MAWSDAARAAAAETRRRNKGKRKQLTRDADISKFFSAQREGFAKLDAYNKTLKGSSGQIKIDSSKSVSDMVKQLRRGRRTLGIKL